MADVSVLEFIGVESVSELSGRPFLRHVDLALEPGKALWVRLDDDVGGAEFSDLAEGLVVPLRGEVRFQGKPWAGIQVRRQMAMRGRIGRVFEGQGWVENIRVMNNLTLGQLHHTRRPAAEIFDEAVRMAKRVGLETIPDALPDGLPPGVMKRVEWVRAFLGRPSLVILERPESAVPGRFLSGLKALVEDAQRAGTAVLGLLGDSAIWRDHAWDGRRLVFKKESGVLEEVGT
jgi:phospholipid/cholesterol/gamma-HCH transport system ATP-binding protein